MRIFTVAVIAAALAAPALAAEDATVTTSATEAVGNAIAVSPLPAPKSNVAEDTQSLFSDVHGSVSLMVGTGGAYGVGGDVSGTYADKFHFSVSGSKSRGPGVAGDVYGAYGTPGPRALPRD
ncbi:MAG: hypothetical protein QM698_11615 [Micropepsaceae bacterium]